MQPGIKVSHIRVTSEDDLYKLKGSKYVQSTVGSAYKDAITDLKAGKKVLFIGTPCQVAVMKKISNKYAEHLYTIDLICHGVPSLKYLQQHAAKMIGGDIKDVIAKFRDSNNMYLLLLLLLPDGSYKELYRSNLWVERYKDTYYNAFIDEFLGKEV